MHYPPETLKEVEPGFLGVQGGRIIAGSQHKLAFSDDAAQPRYRAIRHVLYCPPPLVTSTALAFLRAMSGQPHTTEAFVIANFRPS